MSQSDIIYEYLKPEDCTQLTKIRVGKDGDGGYIVPKEILKHINVVVTFGVNDEDSFERDLSQKLDQNKCIPFHLCDPFCGYTLREGNEMFEFHSIGLDEFTNQEKQMISWPDFRQKKLSNYQSGICLKIDIEFAEWDSLYNLLERDFEGVYIIIIEFHSLFTRFDSIDKQRRVLQLLNSMYHLYHIHSNNNGFVIEFNPWGMLPDVIECTFIRKDWAKENKYTFTPREASFPEELDQPCYSGKVDPSIHWWKAQAQL